VVSSPTSDSLPRLLIGTNNAGKVREFRALLDGSGWEVVAPADIGLTLEVEETGATYEENARQKAAAFTAASGLPSLADDSGLEVDALNGEPGPLHHINNWDGRDQADRIGILLRALQPIPPAKRTCRYLAIVLVRLPDGRELRGEGSCDGLIVDEPKGTNGFGYDPVFFLPSRGLTVAEMSSEEKNSTSHRAQALAQIAEQLKALARSWA